MRKLRFGVVAVACFTAVSLSAQTTPSTTPDQQSGAAAQSSPASASSDAQSKVTVTGCLERGKASEAAAGTSGTAGTSGASASASARSESAKFILNNVSSPAAAATGTSGSDKASASSYRLDGDDAKLTPHIGHKIEVTGTVEKSATGASMSASAPKLKVDSVKMVAASCMP